MGFSLFRKAHRQWVRLPVRYRGAVVVAIPAMCLLITFGAWIWSRQTAIDAQERTDRTQQLIFEMGELLNDLIDAETAVRGYSITQDRSFLEPYERSVVEIPQTQAQLADLLLAQPGGQVTFDRFQQLSMQRMRALEELLEIVETEVATGGNPASDAEVERLLFEGKQIMDQFRLEAGQFQEQQLNVLESYLQQRSIRQERTTTLLWLTLVISLLGSFAALYLFSSLDNELESRELLLRENKSLLQAVVSNVVDGVITLDRQGKIEIFNPSASRMFGYQPYEVVGRELDILLEDAVMPDQHGMISPGVSWNQKWQTRGLRRVGSPFPVEISVSDMQLDDRSIAIIRDITEFQQAEDKLKARADELVRLTAVLAQTNAALESRNRELEQFAYVASHDLKAPLRAIASLSEWLEEDLADQLPDENRKQLQLLRGRVLRMEALINGLLDYSRIGRTKTALEPVVVDDLLAEVIDSLAPPPSFRIDIAPGMPTLTTRRVLLRQVFANLIGNAIKHNDRPDGHIKILVEDQGDAYEFTIADNGPGIAPEYHKKIFAIFQTLEARDTKEGTGIGLSIVKKIVETEGGTIRIESQEGMGTAFHFTWLKQALLTQLRDTL
ncbi:diguanylate cyclase [filamentous cyanobacterium CCP2]|nr:diguanylate cyclase [filamentous cyanobacterium CCP2]